MKRECNDCGCVISSASAPWQQLLASGKAPKNVERYYRFLAAQDKFTVVDNAAPKVKAQAQQVRYY